jgi:hypothetical protein
VAAAPAALLSLMVPPGCPRAPPPVQPLTAACPPLAWRSFGGSISGGRAAAAERHGWLTRWVVTAVCCVCMLVSMHASENCKVSLLAGLLLGRPVKAAPVGGGSSAPALGP